MGIIIRQSAKSSIVTYIGVVIGTINVLYLYNKFMSPEQLGLYVALTSFPLVFAGIAHLGTPLVAVRFFNQLKDDQNKHNGLLGYILLVPLIGFIFFVFFYWIAKGSFTNIYQKNSPLLVQYFWVFAILGFFMMYQSVLEAYARAHLRIVIPAVIREIYQKLANSALALLFGFGFISFNVLVVLLVVVYGGAVFALCIYIIWLGKWYLHFDKSLFKKPIFKEMYRYGFWTLLGGLAGIVLPHIEKLMLPAYSGGLENTAIFNIAASIALVISIPRNTISAISDPIIAQNMHKNNLKEVSVIYQKSALNLSILGIFLFLGIWCNITDIFNIIPNADIYKQGKYVVLMVGLYAVFDMATGLNSEILKNSKYYKVDFSFYVIRCVALLLSNLILIPKYGMNGAAFSMLISIIIYNIIKYFYIYSKFQIQPFTTNWMAVIGIGLFSYFVIIFIQKQISISNPIINISLNSALILITFLLPILYFKISTDFSNVFKAIVQKLSKN